MSDDTAIFSGTEDDSESQEHRDAQEVLQAQYQTCFGTPQGEAVLESLYGFCGQTRSSFVGGDPHRTSYNEGRRDVILAIMKMVAIDDLSLIARSRDRALKGK